MGSYFIRFVGGLSSSPNPFGFAVTAVPDEIVSDPGEKSVSDDSGHNDEPARFASETQGTGRGFDGQTFHNVFSRVAGCFGQTLE